MDKIKPSANSPPTTANAHNLHQIDDTNPLHNDTSNILVNINNDSISNENKDILVDINDGDHGDDENEQNSINRLTPELIMKAELEVNEKDSWRIRDIEALREIIRMEPSLHCRMDDSFLLRFLRASRFDYDRAFRLICDYYQLFIRNSELFLPIIDLKCVFDSNCMMVMDNGRTKNDETIFLLRLGKWDPRKFSFDHIISAAIVSMELVIKDPITQISGIVCLIDMNGFGWSQLRKFGPSQAKKVIQILDKCLPIRIKTIYVINESTLADIGFAIMRPFINEELHEKIVFLGSNFHNQLYKIIMPELLPNEFSDGNGVQKQGPMNCEHWFKKLCMFEKEMKHNFNEYGFIKNSNNQIPMVDLNGKICSNSIICRGGTGNANNGNNNGLEYNSTITGGGGGGGGFNGTDMKTLFRKSQTCNGYLFDYYNTSSVD